MKKRIAILLVLLMLMTLVVACGDKSDTGTNGGDTTPPTSEEPGKEDEGEAPVAADPEVGKSDGVFDACIASEPESIDPALNTSVDGATMIQHTFEGLIKWVADGNGNATLAPGQAEKWDISEDGLTWTFHLRKEAKWSDGKEVTANDFVYAWNRLVNEETGADYEYMLDMVEGYDDKKLNIKAIDDKTFEIKLATKFERFDEICAFAAAFPVREDIVEGNDGWTLSKETYISNGPYKMVEWKHNSYILYEKNPEYYDTDSYTAEKLKFHLKDDVNAIYAAYRSGELDFIEQVPQDEIAKLVSAGELKVMPYVGTYFVCFNTQVEPFDDARVREAFTLTIDRNFITEKITASGQVPAAGFVPSGVYDAKGNAGDDFRTVGGDYYSLSDDDYAANCEKARQLLKEAGYEGGAGFPVVEYLYNTSENHRLIGEALQNMWQSELGVTATLQNQDWNVFIVDRKQGAFSIARHGWIADYNDPMTFIDMFMTGGGNNDAQYENPEFDKLVKEAKQTSDQAKRMELMHKAEDLLVGRDYAVGPIYFYTNKYMMKPNIEGLYYTPLGYFFFGGTKGY